MGNRKQPTPCPADLVRPTPPPPPPAKRVDGTVLTCVYCGHAYPAGTPPHGAVVLTDHIRVCETHPMRKVEADKAKLRGALVGLVGCDSADELKNMEAFIRIAPMPEADRISTLNAIHALLEVA